MSIRALLFVILCLGPTVHAQDGWGWSAFPSFNPDPKNCYPTSEAACRSRLGTAFPSPFGVPIVPIRLISANGNVCRAESDRRHPDFPDEFIIVEYSMQWCELPAEQRIAVTIDPGHGFSCSEKGMAIGAMGVTEFTTPPLGRLREDVLTLAIAEEVVKQMPSSYHVFLTKTDVDSCPSFLSRGRVANNSSSKLFVSLHINAPGFFLPGTLTLWNVNKSGSFNVAESMARDVSSAVGVNNRGPKVDNEIAVLKPTVTNMNAVLLEVTRLSGRDEELLHAPTAPSRIASGVVSSVRGMLRK
jgi:N-acetylmuramoyl-L-alanine amidase